MDNEVHVHEDRPSLPFCNNGNEQFLSQLCDEKQEQPDSNLLLNNSKILTSTFAVQFEKQQEELNQRIKFQVRINMHKVLVIIFSISFQHCFESTMKIIYDFMVSYVTVLMKLVMEFIFL